LGFFSLGRTGGRRAGREKIAILILKGKSQETSFRGFGIIEINRTFDGTSQLAYA
jgi:hypothetical protein